MSEFSGHDNLEIVSKNHKFNKWIYEQIRPFLRGDILEIGSGIGTISEKIIDDSTLSSQHIMLTDVSTTYVQELQQKFSSPATTNEKKMKVPRNISVHKLDLNLGEDYESIGYEKFDSIIASNVLEHIEDDDFALRQLYQVLRGGGSLIILVPCHKFLFNVIDESIGHFRRYTKRELIEKLERSQFTLNQVSYFNSLGIIGWYINGNLLHRPVISTGASRVFNSLVPVLKPLEKISGPKTGLSIICCASKKQSGGNSSKVRQLATRKM